MRDNAGRGGGGIRGSYQGSLTLLWPLEGSDDRFGSNWVKVLWFKKAGTGVSHMALHVLCSTRISGGYFRLPKVILALFWPAKLNKRLLHRIRASLSSSSLHVGASSYSFFLIILWIPIGSAHLTVQGAARALTTIVPLPGPLVRGTAPSLGGQDNEWHPPSLLAKATSTADSLLLPLAPTTSQPF